MLRVGFVGLGDLGAPMARNVQASSFELEVFARKPSTVDEWKSAGVTCATSLRELGAACDLVCVIVVDDKDVREVMSSDNLLGGMRSGSHVLIHSTVHPDTCRELSKVARQQGVGLLDAPVSGGALAAQQGRLTLMVGGEEASYDLVMPVLRTFGSTIELVGPVGSGQLAKLINSYILVAHMATAWAEFDLINAVGLAVEPAARALCAATGASRRFQSLASMNFDESRRHSRGMGFLYALCSKDIRLFRELPDRHSVDLTTLDSLIDEFLRAASGENHR